ncbi:bifunctional oligoribonuclease/PAP phosphatase NrnA [Candidatus Lokiarchaeum ossiferum]|uniref:bifunctional oligoribonuclease/PAP phosphatase NrnA n=1 Tax=Candidatus Lokiarchaeum ossiferum TaxID=2951803 RepID=UPI00352F5720
MLKLFEVQESIKQFLPMFLLEVKQATSIGITAHTNADPDALAAAMGLKSFLIHMFPSKEVKIILPQLNKIAEKVYKEVFPEIPTFLIERNWPPALDLLILVDTGDLNITELPPKFIQDTKGNLVKRIIIIDHHTRLENLDDRVICSLILGDLSSTAEIISLFYQLQNIIPTPEIIKILLLGIITDTGHFRYANTVSLENTKYLLEEGDIQLSDVTLHLQKPMTRSEKIARIRGAMRVEKLHLIKDYVIAFSHVSSYEASACKALIELGYDVSFVISYEKNKNGFRISSRAKEQIIKHEGLHLGKLLTEIGSEFNGSGGGHDGAAGCYGILAKEASKNKPKTFMDQIIPPVLKKLRKIINNP